MKRELTKEELESVKVKDEALSKMIELIGDMSLTNNDAIELREELDDNYRPDDLSSRELIDELEGHYLDGWEKQELLEMCDCEDYDELLDFKESYQNGNLGGGTLDAQMRHEVILKLEKSVTSLTELETLLGEDILERLKFVMI
jgi:hypothetical protein